jgi:nucleotide-binding universal stress UspA family protein
MAVCSGTKRDGTPCTAAVGPGERWCYHHDPARAEERRRNASRAASAKHSPVAQELREVRDLIWELLGLTIADRLPYKARRELQNVVQLLQCYLRAVELEMRAAEEPLKGNLDVKGLRAQVLERIEELEAREREKEELLAGVTAVAEEHGLDVGPLRVVLDG